MTQHTPGPWTYKAGYIRHGETYLAEVLVGPDCEDATIGQANARLIAASPSLLAALQWIANHGDTGAGGRPAFHDMRDHARKAINLAERGRP